MPKKNGTETVSISLESELITALDYYARLNDLNRSLAVRQAIKQWIASKVASDPNFFDRLYYGINNKSKQGSIF